VVADAFVLALNNGGDWPTWEVLERFDDLIDLTVATQKLLPIGESVSYLFKIAQELETEYLLHLEDDWEAGLDGGIFQVRLRQADERVLPNHMVSKHPLRWTIWPDGYRTSPDAHYTLNPSLIRLEDVGKGWPASSEKQAQRKFWNAELRKVAQLVPGIWRHTGEVHSLRKLVG
jgi:hypothetical protein